MEFGAAVFSNGAWIGDGEFGEERIVMDGAAAAAAAALRPSLQQVEEHEPVLKRAASVFFADMVASSSSDTFCRPSPTNKDTAAARESSLEPFPFAHPLWEDFEAGKLDKCPAPPNLLDLNIPLLVTKVGGGGDGEEDPLIDFQEFQHRRYDESKEAFSQIHYSGHDVTWQSASATFNSVRSFPHGRSYGDSVSDAFTGPPPPVSCSATNVQVDANFFDQLYSQETASQLEDLLAMDSLSTKHQDLGSGLQVEKPLYSRIRSQEEDEQDLEFGNFCDGNKPVQRSGLQGECQALVTSISILSKVLLSHYGAGEKDVLLQHKEVKGLQSAILDLSKCLAHAHSRSITLENNDASQVEESKNESWEDPNFGLYSDNDEQNGEHDEDGNEQLMTRFKILLGLQGAGKHVGCPSPEDEALFSVKPELEKQPESSIYLNSNEVEQRLELLRNRPNVIFDEDVSKVEIHVGDDYVAKCSASLKELSDQLQKNVLKEAAPAGGKTSAKPDEVYSSAPDKSSDSSEESGWEHI